MSERDVQVVLDQFEAVNERDFARAMEGYADDVVLVIEEGFLNAGTFEGKKAVGDWFGDWFRAFGRDFRFENVDPQDLGGGLIFLFARYRATGRVSGAEVADRRAYLYRVEDDMITRVQLFLTREAALEAASLPEWSDPKTD
jgi:ketosteroid isomerase-like protein